MTAIEWLVSVLLSGKPLMPSLIKQAKEIEKQRIIDGIVQYQIKYNKILSEQGILNVANRAEQYYNETYKNK